MPYPMNPAKKMIVVAGARPNFMKVAPLLDKMKARPDRFNPYFVHTGQHYDDKMSNSFLRDLGMPEPDAYLGAGSSTHAVQTAKVMIEFENVLFREKPDCVLVVGDVNSTLACALDAAKQCIPVAHVEAGLRSRDRTMPEEINRCVTDQLSDFLFTTCPEAGENLEKEGVPRGKIHFVGNIMIESMIRNRERVDRSGILGKLGLKSGQYALLTLHRPANVDKIEILREVFSVLGKISERIQVLFPVHPRTRARIREFGLIDETSPDPRFMLSEPIEYFDFLSLEKNAGFVMTDSGGVQEETTYYQVPCLTFRDNTERPITVAEGTNLLVGTDPAKLHAACNAILDGSRKRGKVPQLWDGDVSERILKVLSG
jgi:UDP-N-acetylglucosamine 2-epimerase (non-hydrolysing)